MPADQLSLTLIQPDIIWEAKERNLLAYERMMAEQEGTGRIVVLPEMFSTGFSMQPDKLAESMEGPTVSWMAKMASKHRCILTGSMIIEDAGQYFNRLIWMQPDGKYGFYDKRHLFAFAGEDEHYAAGGKKLIVSVNGWRVCPLICYDLRFPVWARNEPEQPYDVLLYVANWPERRRQAWKVLLQARAIENQAYVVGCNRVGTDGNGNLYSGDSCVFDALGTPLWQQADAAVVKTLTLDKSSLQEIRTGLPFLKDADPFLLRS